MAEETKQEEKKENAKRVLSTIFKVILGLAFLAFGAWLVYKGWVYLWYVIKGTVGLFFILAGIITLAIAKE
jgi:mannose/fructose/N-acetylgalactosamine-specific phosphotransferase system component IID